MRSIPYVSRTVEGLAAYEHIGLGGMTLNVMAQWEDGSVARPEVLITQDIYSRKLLLGTINWARFPGAALDILLSTFERFGVPHVVWGTSRDLCVPGWPWWAPSRFLDLLNVEWRVGEVGMPIVSALRELRSDLESHGPLWEARCTRRAKPDRWRWPTIQIDALLSIANDVVGRHNRRPGRNNEVCHGRLSLDEAFWASYRKERFNPIEAVTLRRFRDALAADQEP